MFYEVVNFANDRSGAANNSSTDNYTPIIDHRLGRYKFFYCMIAGRWHRA